MTKFVILCNNGVFVGTNDKNVFTREELVVSGRLQGTGNLVQRGDFNPRFLESPYLSVQSLDTVVFPAHRVAFWADLCG